MSNIKDEDVYCVICGKTFKEAPQLMFYRNDDEKAEAICEDCVETIYLRKHTQSEYSEIQRKLLDPDIEEEPEERKIPKPSEIRDYLDQHIIGQDAAKEVISVAAYNHYKYLSYAEQHKDDTDQVELQRSNILLIGPSGVGKTETVRALSKFMNVPLAICDTTSLSKTGFVGADPVSILTNLLTAAGGNVTNAERGIVYLDEFDKLANRGADNTARDVTGEGVQMELLKMVEGNTVDVPISGTGMRSLTETVRIDTSHILFICGGAFNGIEKVIKERIKSSAGPTIGFGTASAKEIQKKEYDELLPLVTTDDLKKYGIMQEMLGRLPVICTLKELTVEELIAILTQPKNAIVKQYSELFKMDKTSLTFQEDALQAIAQDAIQRKVGARGLRSILEKILQPVMYKLPDIKGSKEVVITKECVVAHNIPEIKQLKRGRKPRIQKVQQQTAGGQ